MPVTRALLAVAMCVWTLPLLARTLEVGQGHEFKQPSEAVAAAEERRYDRDLSTAQYFDCAIVRQNDLH